MSEVLDACSEAYPPWLVGTAPAGQQGEFGDGEGCADAGGAAAAGAGALVAVCKFVKEWGQMRAIDRVELAQASARGLLRLPLSNALAAILRGGGGGGGGGSARNAGEEDGGCHDRHSTALPYNPNEMLCGWCGAQGREGSRFCSSKCSEQFAVVASSSAVRRQLYELEKGVCQICRVDSHSVFKRIKALPQGPERLAAMMEMGVPVQGRTDSMLKNPKEGDFWQADHIRPVCEGGGQADIRGFRTLCTACHQKETNKLHLRLKQRKTSKAAAGSGDIRAFFGGS